MLLDNILASLIISTKASNDRPTLYTKVEIIAIAWT